MMMYYHLFKATVKELEQSFKCNGEMAKLMHDFRLF